jgi:hypothetical protein
MNVHEDGTMTADRELSRCKKVSPTGDDLPQKRARKLRGERQRVRRRQHRTAFVRNRDRNGAMRRAIAARRCIPPRVGIARSSRVGAAVAKRRQRESEVPARICDAERQSLSPDGDSFRGDSACIAALFFLACCKPLFCR